MTIAPVSVPLQAPAQPDAAQVLGPADAYVARILNLVGTHAHAIHAMLTVSRVEWSREVATACVECQDRPRLLLNPDFVQRWCHTPERLAALIVHELMHIALGHTRLYPQPTAIHNIAFDAIINRSVLDAIMAGGANVQAYALMFTDFYAPDASPSFLLRPPPGWPLTPDWQASHGQPEPLRDVHRRLYGVVAASNTHDIAPTYTQVMYADIIQALRSSGLVTEVKVELLGAHGTTEVEITAMGGARTREIAEAWAQALDTLRDSFPGEGSSLGLVRIAPAARTASLEAAIRTLLNKVAMPTRQSRARQTWQQQPIMTVHRWHDRRTPSRIWAAQQLGAPTPLLFRGQVSAKRADRTRIDVYLDVSGSMHAALPHLSRALLSLWRAIRPTLYWFSNAVVPATDDAMHSGLVHTTGGTSISVVLRHLLDQQRRNCAVLVLTDGHIERVARKLSAEIRQRRIAVHLGVIGNGPLHADQPWVASSVRLPLPTAHINSTFSASTQS